MSLLITLVLTLAAIWLQRRYYHVSRPAGKPTGLRVRAAWQSMRPELRRLLVANSMVCFGAGMSSTFVVLYVLNRAGGSALEFGFLASVRTLARAALLIPAAKLADRAGKRSRRPFVAGAFRLRTVFPLALVVAPSVSWLFVVFIIPGLAEVGDVARKAFLVDLAEGEQRGSVIGTYYLVAGAAVFPASFLGGWLWEWTPIAPFVAGAGVTALGLLWFLVPGPRLPKKQKQIEGVA